MQIQIDIGPGELIDRLTITAIKAARASDATKAEAARSQLTQLRACVDRHLPATPALASLEQALRAVNEELWDLENTVRRLERAEHFDTAFVAAARRIYQANDERAALRHRINQLWDRDAVDDKDHVRD
jgi:hypothetical protein